MARSTPLWKPLEQRIAESTAAADDLVRDPEHMRRNLPLLERYTALFAPEVRGFENVPERGPFLLVGNHSGLYWFPDTWVMGVEWLHRRGFDEPLYTLVYDLLFAVPKVAEFLRGFGCVPASAAHARAALDTGAAVLVYPGGDWEACRPWSQRNRIDFGGRTGFARVALESGVPVVPVVSHGSHHSVFVVSRGERLARVLGLPRVHIHVFPLILSVPLGPGTILTPTLPVPSQVTIQVLPPLDWSHLGTAAARDDAVVRRCAEELTSQMQATLDRLSAERRFPVLRRWIRPTR